MLDAEVDKVAVLESKLKKQQEINYKLAARIKLLENALKQQMYLSKG